MRPAVDDPTRRNTLAAGVSLGALGVGVAWHLGGSEGGANAAGASASAGGPAEGGAEGQGGDGGRRVAARLPSIYLPHGGGPWPFVETGFGDPQQYEGLKSYLVGLAERVGQPIRALLVVSAHWEEPEVTVMSGASPRLLFDYSGFPAESYRLTWPAPGEPALAARVQQLLQGRGIKTAANSERGYDHGTFVPLKLAFPRADVPVVQVSLKVGLDPAEHLAIGQALAPLRDEGVLIVGSGMSYHNMRGFGARGLGDSEAFDAWLQAAVQSAPAKRRALLEDWASAPAARLCHPREEHLLPLHVVAGAAGDGAAEIAYSSHVLGVKVSAVHFA